jgi:hypothetical protein
MGKLSTSTAALSPTSFAIKPLLAAALLLAALVVPCAYAQGPFIYVANAGEDTVSKIDVTLNQEVARYATWFTPGSANHVVHTPIPPTVADRAHQGPAPSRIAQDSAGNVYVLDRFWGPHLPVLLKIAPTGAPTSSGSGFSAVLPMLDNNPTNNDIDIPSEAADKRILWAKPIGNSTDAGQLGRALAIDTTGILWVGIYGIAHYYRVDPSNGNVLAPSTGIPFPTIAGKSYGAYSAQVDVNGKLWSVDEHQTLTEIDTLSATYPATPHDHTSYGDNYSVSIFNDCSTTPPKVKVYLPEHRLGKTYIVYDPQTSTWGNAPAGVPQFKSVAIGVDTKGNIVSGEWHTTGRVIKTGPSGNVLWDTGTPPAAQQISDLHGLIIDGNDDVWVVDWYGNRVIKYSGATGSYLATVQVGDQPYTYGNTPPPTCSAGGSPTPTPTPTPTATPTATPGCASITDKEVRCLPDGSYSYTFNVTNNSGAAMSQVLLTPVNDGTFTLAPQLSKLGSPLASGQSTTITTNIGHVKPGEKVCFFLSLLSDNAPCCIVQVCPTLPPCGELPSPHPSPTPQRR